jgi:hypothetical protein
VESFCIAPGLRRMIMIRLATTAILLCAAQTALGGILPSPLAEALSGRPSPPQVPHPAVVRVVAPERDGTALGSGALVAISDQHGLVVTNWHVVRDATGPVTVIFPDGFRSSATVLRVDRNWDLAGLAIWRPNVQPIPLATAAPRPGEPLAIAGYGSGPYRAAAGRCTQYLSPGRGFPAELVELSTAARQGDSGGPILNGRGELAGVLFGAGDGCTMGSYCGRVRWFLSSITTDLPMTPGDGTMIAQQTPAPQYEPRRPVAAIPVRQAPTSVAADVPGAVPRATASVPGSPPPTAPGTVGQAGGGTPAAGQTGDSAGPRAISWQDLAGTTWGEQLKTLLAAIGGLALLLQAARLFGGGENVQKKKA